MSDFWKFLKICYLWLSSKSETAASTRKVLITNVVLSLISTESSADVLLEVVLGHSSYLQVNLPEFLLFFFKFHSVVQLYPTICYPMYRSTPGLLVHHQIPESTQTHVHCVGDAIQTSHPLSSPSPPALNLSQHHGLFKWVRSSHEVAKLLEFQLQHQSFQWTPRTDLL